VALANQVEAEVARRGAAYPSTPWRIAAAHAHLALGDDERARALIAAQRPITDRWDTPRLHAATLRAEARILRGDEAIDRLRSAVEHVAGSPSRLELARSLVALGELLRRGGQRVECREPLREGLELARLCGALPLAERAATELRATGARERKVLLSGAASLTASELRICRLAAEGLTNREIAQDLWVTRKTVETHLSHAFRKLDVRGRGELAAALDGDQARPA
jgi:DNA-binding CsgD family transcriptional regulator